MIRIGLLGASGIAPASIIQPTAHRDDCTVSCIASRDPVRARAYADAHDVADIADDYDALIARNDIDLVFNGLMHDRHADLSIAALRAGKHVLCEKPIAMNAREARAMVDASRETGRILIEAFHYRFHPVFLRVLDLLPRLGPITQLTARSNVNLPRDSTRFVPDLGGGGLMDVGCYPLHMARTVLNGETKVLSASAFADGSVDLSMSAELRIGGVLAHIECSIIAEDEVRDLRVEGMRGTLHLTNPVHPYRGHTLSLTVDGQTKDETLPNTTPTYDYQLAHVVDVLMNGVEPLTGGADAVANMAAIDAIYTAAGMSPR